MVILMKVPKGLVLSRLIEKRFEKITGIKGKLKDFISPAQFAFVAGIPEVKVFRIIAHSKKLHGYILNNEDLRIHPSAVKYLSKQMIKRIQKESSGDLTEFGYTKRIAATYR